MRSIKLAVSILFVCLFVGFELTEIKTVSGQATSLTAPTGFIATDNLYNSKVGLYWDAVRGATTYRLFRNTTDNPVGATDIGATPANSFFDLGAVPGQQFFYWVRAESGSVLSSFSSSDQGVRAAAQQQGPIPPLEPPPVPPGNPVTAAKTYLGKTLFWDEQLSSTRTVSCGSCHHSGNGGTDPRSAASPAQSTNPGPDLILNTADDITGSAGVPVNNADGTYTASANLFNDQVTGRKTVSYINAGYAPVLFWDGRATGLFRDPISNATILNAGGALESQVLGPPVSDVEMSHAGRSWTGIASRMTDAKPLVLSPSVPAALDTWIGGRSYPELFQEAFGSPEVTPARIAMAIATFERSLYSDQAPVDLSSAGIAPLTPQEQRGRGVFNASSCNVCHAGNLFTDNSFRYIGVRPQNDDTGRFQVTGNNNNRGEFRVPSLRNVELRKSFFHNGRFTALEDVVAFYNRGGDFNAPNKPNNLIRPLGLNANQQADLVAFLRRPLTDPRVAAEGERFDRPLLYMESSRVPQITGIGRAGSNSVTPQIKAISPPLVGNPNFTVSLSSALGNAPATLVISETDPDVGSSIPATGSFARVVTNTQNTGAGNGWVSVSLPIPNSTAVAGRTYFARWYVQDGGAAFGFSVSPAARFTVFGNATETPNITISGRVLTPDGAGLRNATVTLTDSGGFARRVTTSSFGVYTFDNIPAGASYIASVASKRYRFAPQSITPTSNISSLDLIGLQ
ncbi:MAG: cytochrome c peroxidase [Pyrinomonadaceae bacterium]